MRLAAVFVFLLAALPAGAAEGLRPCPDCPVMVTVPPGRYALSATEITFDQWQACVEAGGCTGGQDDHGWGKGSRPVINITWDQARAYAAWVSGQAGRVCRLPTEAEWEHAARAGTTTGFWWGEEAGTGHATCRDCLGKEPPYGTTPAASFKPNPWGLYDMNGNVWEWTADCWTPNRAAPPAPDPSCRDKVIKGGSWYYFSTMSKAGARARNDGLGWSYNIGVRLLCETP